MLLWLSSLYFHALGFLPLVSLITQQLVLTKWHWAFFPDAHGEQKEGPWAPQLRGYTCCFFWDNQSSSDKWPHKAHKGQHLQSGDEPCLALPLACPLSPVTNPFIYIYIYIFKRKSKYFSCAPQLYLFAAGSLPWGTRDVSKAYLFSFCLLLADLTAVLIWPRELCQSASKLHGLYGVYWHYSGCVQQVGESQELWGHCRKVQTVPDSGQICLQGGRI